MVNSLLTAIVRADGDALVMHVGERPYVVASSGPVELSSRPLTLEAVAGMLAQLLPADVRQVLDELGAVEHELPKSAAGQGDRFTVVAARGGEDIWIEVRRHRRVRMAPRAPQSAVQPAAPVQAAAPMEAAAAVEAAPPVHTAAPVVSAEPAAPAVVESVPAIAAVAASAPSLAVAVQPAQAAALASPSVAAAAVPSAELRVAIAESVAVAQEPTAIAPELPGPVADLAIPPVEPPIVAEPPVAPVLPEPLAAEPAASAVPTAAVVAEAGVTAMDGAGAEPPVAVAPQPVHHERVVPVVSEPARETAVERRPAPEPATRPVEQKRVPHPVRPEAVSAPRAERRPAVDAEPIVRPLVATPIVERPASSPSLPVFDAAPAAASVPSAAPSPTLSARPAAPPVPEPGPAVVLPLARSPIRMDAQSRSLSSPRIAGIDRLLRLASARGANTLYLMSQARPSVRVDGEIAVLDAEPVLSAHEVESLLLDLAPERSREALEAGEGTEWMSEVPEVGRIRCQSFRDHRGAGGIFRMISARPTTAEQLGLAREIQALCAEPEGLVLVAGPRASGKSTLVSALVDIINRTRNDYVITVESQIAFAHESRGCLVSQREVRGGNEETAMVVRGALRENPDVLVIEDMRSPEVVRLALEAMEAGHLVIGTVSAHGAATAIGRMLDQAPEERRGQMRLALAEGLRGVVSQVLLRKTSGGRVAAREVLLNLPSIANLIAEGRISQLPLAIDSGRKHGMVPLNDALAAFVQNGVVDVKEAYRKAFERQAFLAVLRREGVDTSFVERLA